MEIQQNISLANLTTFFIGGLAKYFCRVETAEDLIKALEFSKQNKLNIFILGKGSNVLVSDEGFDGLVIQIAILGKEIVLETKENITLSFGAGEIWDEVVFFAVQNNWWGIENLSHIPGTVGAFPVQNVGAYGQEASQVITRVTVFDTQTQQSVNLSNQECEFRYRKSIFNSTAKGRYIVLGVELRLSKNPAPNLSYGDLKEYFISKQPEEISLAEIRTAIIEIRNKKFPYPDSPEKGNSGSFFRGPLLTEAQFKDLEKIIAEKFSTEEVKRLEKMRDRLKVSNGYKTPTAFLIDICNLKNYEINGALINSNQPAIILNSSGQAKASDVFALYEKVKQEVERITGVHLEHEPEFIGF